MFRRQLTAPDGSFFLLGPRGTGKTTWIHAHVKAAQTYDLLQVSESLRLNRDPSLFGRECQALPARSWIVVDEVQKAPLLLDEVQRLIEERKQRFVLSGSSARKLRRGGANLLAGRAEVRHLFPFVSVELDFKRDLDEVLEHGMLPLAVTGRKPRAFLKAYVETYLHQEIQAEAIVRQIGAFARFLEVAARMNGQVVNASWIARDAGVARQTAQGFFDILSDTLIGSWLPAWRAKRSVKQVQHPKFYLFDCGVARHLAGMGHFPVHPEERGFLLETYILHEVRAYLHYTGRDYPTFYWRTHDGAEIDLLVESPRGMVAIEVKASERWDSRFHANLLAFRKHHGGPRTILVGIHCGLRTLEQDRVRAYPWKEFLRRLWAGELIR